MWRQKSRKTRQKWLTCNVFAFMHQALLWDEVQSYKSSWCLKRSNKWQMYLVEGCRLQLHRFNANKYSRLFERVEEYKNFGPINRKINTCIGALGVLSMNMTHVRWDLIAYFIAGLTILPEVSVYMIFTLAHHGVFKPQEVGQEVVTISGCHCCVTSPKLPLCPLRSMPYLPIHVRHRQNRCQTLSLYNIYTLT